MVRESVQSSECLPTLSEILARSESERAIAAASESFDGLHRAAREAQRQWHGAIAALEQMLGAMTPQRDDRRTCGLVLSNSRAILTRTFLMGHLAVWNFTTTTCPMAQLPGNRRSDDTGSSSRSPQMGTIFLGDGDPLETEQFCLVLTHQFTLVAARGLDPAGLPVFQFSFDPDTAKKAWQCLRDRIVRTERPQTLTQLERIVHQFAIVPPHYKVVTQFARQLLEHLPDSSAVEGLPQLPQIDPNIHRYSLGRQDKVRIASPQRTHQSDGTEEPAENHSSDLPPTDESEATSPDIELLQAIAHEVRTPLSTIRTLTRLLLKRKDLASEVLKWLEAIDRECSEQIDRFGLIFKAVELETSQTHRSPVHLTRTCLDRVVSSCIPRWQKQASRRSLKLDVSLPPTMPQVVSDPTMLDRVLTGTVENFTSSLPAGSHVTVEIALAGDRLKLQLKAQGKASENYDRTPSLKSIGKLLMFQPETGNLSLNLSVTKNLFQALGGKLIVRSRPQQGEEMTIFLPLE
ncbi:MAG: HAMP domain-containing sensor histidine kinase [Cyanobacteriota bacterium]|nr:HAMP domain-containing sensor histidine kinase [Cyanobacteriota bacterium]